MATKKKPTHTLEVSHQTQMNFPVDDKRIKQIQNCLKKGTLKITVSKVDLAAGGRFRGAYEYD